MCFEGVALEGGKKGGIWLVGYFQKLAYTGWFLCVVYRSFNKRYIRIGICGLVFYSFPFGDEKKFPCATLSRMTHGPNGLINFHSTYSTARTNICIFSDYLNNTNLCPEV